jgi:glycosyltransferase involved in cell wall biosynthesis
MFLIRSLNYGGTERQLVALASRLHEKGESVGVVTFYPGGPFHKNLEAIGIAVYTLEKRSRWDMFFFFRLIRLMRRLQPAIVHSYLGVPNILTILLKPMFPGTRFVWGVRASNMDLNRYGWLDQFLYQIERALSRSADLIIVNSYSGLDHAIAQGFPRDKMRVIPNGIDTDQFRPDPESGKQFRKDWCIGEKEHLIGIVGRLDPMKDHPTFLKAAALLARERTDVRFLCVGDGPQPYQSRLRSMSEELGLGKRLIWLSSAEDMSAIYNAMDVMTSASSFGEGFSNAIGEAMACGVPCVVTDVGDSKRIVGDFGEVVPPADPSALAQAWSRTLRPNENEQRCRIQIRTRIMEQYCLHALANRTAAALKEIS